MSHTSDIGLWQVKFEFTLDRLTTFEARFYVNTTIVLKMRRERVIVYAYEYALTAQVRIRVD